MTTWRERIAAMKTEGRGPNAEECGLLRNFQTCLVGEQIARGVLPPIWILTCRPPLWTRASDWPYGTLYELGLEATEIYDPDKLDHQLDRIEDEALRLKRELSS